MMPPRSLSPGSQRNSCPGMLIGDRHRRARLSQVLDILETTSFLAAIPCRGLEPEKPLRAKGDILRVQIVSARSRRRNYCSDWGFIEGICGGAQPPLSAA